MSRVLLSSVFAVSLVFVGAARAQSETEFRKTVSEAGRFSVEMPGEAEEETETYEDGTQRHIFTAAPALVVRFHVSYYDFQDSIVSGRDPQMLLKVFREGYRSGVEYQDDREIQLGEAKVPGRQYVIDTGEGVFVRERLLLDGNRMYVLFVAALKRDDVLNKDADRFLDSFAIAK
jgi:hypothetical protein